MFLPGDELPGGVEAIPMRRIEEVAYLLPSHNVVVVGDTILRHGEQAALCPPTWVTKSETFDAAEQAVRSLLRAHLTACCSRMEARRTRRPSASEGRSSCKHAERAARWRPFGNARSRRRGRRQLDAGTQPPSPGVGALLPSSRSFASFVSFRGGTCRT